MERSGGPGAGRPQVAPVLAVRVDSELITAVLRLVAGTAMLVMWAVGGLPPGHPAVLAVALPLAELYAVSVLVAIVALHRATRRYPRTLTVALTGLDNAIILFIAALTGDVSSPVVAILLLVVTTNAARFGLRLAMAVAVVDAGVLAVLALAVPRPPTTLQHRLQLLGWWAWLLLGGAVIAGAIARAALVAERAGAAARRQIEADQTLLAAERDARRRLEEEEADRRDFLRVVTHEVRTPITSLGALTRALTRTGSHLDAAERQEMLALLQSHADHLERLLRGVGDLATATVRTRPDRLVLTEVDLGQLITSAAHAGGVEADRLIIEVDPHATVVRSDAEKLRRILTNLLENAGRHAAGPVEVDAARRDGRLVLRVADRGPGLRPDVAARAFEKGFSFGPERGSSGLGLWIVRELAGVLGGRVWAEARDGGGLMVTVEVPVPAAGDGAPRAPAATGSPPPAGTPG
jgi:signal transduction histidine kinase